MTVPSILMADTPSLVSLVVDDLCKTVEALNALPQKRRLILDLVSELNQLKGLLTQLQYQQLTVPGDSAFSSLQGAIRGALDVADEWQNRKLRFILEGSMLADELSASSLRIKRCLGSLHLFSFTVIAKNSFEDIKRNLKDISNGLRSKGADSEFVNGLQKFKEELVKVLRNTHSEPGPSGNVIRPLDWLANYLDAEVESIKQELQEMMGTNNNRVVEIELVEHLIMCLLELEERNVCSICGNKVLDTSESNEELTCSSCHQIMIDPIILDTGQSKCSYCAETCSWGTVSTTDAGPTGDDDNVDLVTSLQSKSSARVLKNLSLLKQRVRTPRGGLEVAKAGAVPVLIELIQSKNPNRKLFVKPAVQLLEALTASPASDQEKPDKESIKVRERSVEEVADALDVLIPLMQDEKPSKVRLFAAETVANILVEKHIRGTIFAKDGIVPAFCGFLYVDGGDVERAKRVCVKGLTRMAKMSDEGDSDSIIITALERLIIKGHEASPELEDLVKDSLVALKVVVDHIEDAHWEIFLRIQKCLTFLVPALSWHATGVGRKAILSIITRIFEMCESQAKEPSFITEDLIHNLVKVMTIITSQSDREPEVLSSCVKLLGLCVKHAKDMACIVLQRDERKTLEDILIGETSYPDESKLKILSIIDALDIASTGSVVGKLVPILVKMSSDPTCHKVVAKRLRKCVEDGDGQHFSAIQEAGGISALVVLLKDSSQDCQCHALISLGILSRSIKIPTNEIPLPRVLEFLGGPEEKAHIAAIALLSLMLNETPETMEQFVGTPGALEYTIHMLGKDLSSDANREAWLSSVVMPILKMAEEHELVRIRIARAGLGVLVGFVTEQGNNDAKKLMTSILTSSCQSGQDIKESIIDADGHSFLLSSLREKISMEIAAKGLLDLVRRIETRIHVLNAGYVATVVESVLKYKFASMDLAMGLAETCSDEEGLDMLHANRESLQALLILLRGCADSQGIYAAATVIAELCPIFNSADSEQLTLVLEACQLLINLVKTHHAKEILEAIAAIASKNWRKPLHEVHSEERLVVLLEKDDTYLKAVVLQILVQLSEDSEQDNNNLLTKHIRNAMVNANVAKYLFAIVKEPERYNSESVISALTIIRNISHTDPITCEKLCQEGAIPALILVLKRQSNSTSLSPVTELTVTALVQFLKAPLGRKSFVKEGVKSLVAILCQDYGVPSPAKTAAITILRDLATGEDSKIQKTTCNEVFQCGPFLALNSILGLAGPDLDETKWNVAVLMKFVAAYGPTSSVCAAMRKDGSLDSLFALRDKEHCREIADDVLGYISKQDRNCRSQIDTMYKSASVQRVASNRR